jgi:hypothetical protein
MVFLVDDDDNEYDHDGNPGDDGNLRSLGQTVALLRLILRVNDYQALTLSGFGDELLYVCLQTPARLRLFSRCPVGNERIVYSIRFDIRR